MKVLALFGYLLVTVSAGTHTPHGGQKTSLEDIERDYSPNDKSSSYTQVAKASSAPITSPTKFGFVPQRTVSSYAASKPKYQYTQTNYQVKKSPSYKPRSTSYQQQYTQPKAQYTYQQQYSSGSSQPQYVAPEKYSSGSSILDYSQQYSSNSQQHIPQQQQAQDYAYVQPEASPQYTVQYQQPITQYEQYENVQYVADNSIAQPESKEYYSPQPQYYYVQQYQSPSTAVQSIVDPKGFQYVTLVPSYDANSIPTDEKYQTQYVSSAEPQLPPVTTSVAKYTTVVPGKSSGTKQYASYKGSQYDTSPKVQYQPQEEFIIKREPKSLLDSYVPSLVQLQYLRQQSKSSYSKH